jgi:hypothetical protein
MMIHIVLTKAGAKFIELMKDPVTRRIFEHLANVRFSEETMRTLDDL